MAAPTSLDDIGDIVAESWYFEDLASGVRSGEGTGGRVIAKLLELAPCVSVSVAGTIAVMAADDAYGAVVVLEDAVEFRPEFLLQLVGLIPLLEPSRVLDPLMPRRPLDTVPQIAALLHWHALFEITATLEEFVARGTAARALATPFSNHLDAVLPSVGLRYFNTLLVILDLHTGPMYAGLGGILGAVATGDPDKDCGRSFMLSLPPEFFVMLTLFERAAARGGTRGVDFPTSPEFVVEALRTLSAQGVSMTTAEIRDALLPFLDLPRETIIAKWVTAMATPDGGSALVQTLRALTMGESNMGATRAVPVLACVPDKDPYRSVTEALPRDALITGGSLWTLQALLLVPHPPPGPIEPGSVYHTFTALDVLARTIRRFRKSDLLRLAQLSRNWAVLSMGRTKLIPTLPALLSGYGRLCSDLLVAIGDEHLTWQLPGTPPANLLYGARGIGFVMQVLFPLSGAAVAAMGAPATAAAVRARCPHGCTLRFRPLVDPSAGLKPYALVTFASSFGVTAREVAAAMTLLDETVAEREDSNAVAMDALRTRLRDLIGEMMGVALPGDGEVAWTPIHYSRGVFGSGQMTRFYDETAVEDCRGGVVAVDSHTNVARVTRLPLPPQGQNIQATTAEEKTYAWCEASKTLALREALDARGKFIPALGSFNGGLERVEYGY